MNLNRRSVLRGIGAASATLAFTGPASASDGRARYVVGATDDAAARIEAAGFEVLNALAGGNVLLVAGSADAAADLGAISGVSTAVPDLDVELVTPEVEASPAEADGTDVDEVYDELLWDKQVQEVREAHEHATGAGRTIAVLDTGVDDSHPDLNVDVDASATMIDGRPAEHTGDSGYHGTHVAGTAAATGEVGMLGTAPGATVVSVRILGPDTGTWGDVLAGIEYAADVGADAANMSIGTSPIPPEFNAYQYRRLMESVAQTATAAGTLLVGSAGNSDANLQQGGLFTLPNSLAGVVSIGASTPDDERTFYSNYGTNEIDVAAPGGGYETVEKTIVAGPDAVERPWPLNAVFSTVPDEGLLSGPYVDTTIDGHAYGWLMGTSMAAPQVTGLAALVRELEPGANARQVERAIAAGAEGTDGGSDSDSGFGRTNALATVERLL
ncbi:S8 family peptidase [Salinilacihabitans rarus]|uniref:S8 family peptidase n=1 Tax=Salinilacihabitans rarus TaxID=2961596 RepID=UPI0020C9035A|nr:S8 family serine peptidase [Salinilacihabitans rarus]